MTATTTSCMVRPAHIDDLPRLTEIYNHYVIHTATTFDTDPFTVDQRAAWFRRYATTGRHRLMVAERDGTVVWYASTSPFHERRAYETTVEMTVLSAADGIGQRLGQLLYESLVPAIQDEDIRLAIAAITLPNDASCALHERFGFTRAAALPEVGRKFGSYWDVVWYARRFPDRSAET